MTPEIYRLYKRYNKPSYNIPITDIDTSRTTWWQTWDDKSLNYNILEFNFGGVTCISYSNGSPILAIDTKMKDCWAIAHYTYDSRYRITPYKYTNLYERTNPKNTTAKDIEISNQVRLTIKDREILHEILIDIITYQVETT